MTVVRTILVVFFLAFVSGCSSGGGSGSGNGTSISLDRRSLTFNGVEGPAAPASQIVVARFQGDGVIVGYPVGVEEPTWLLVEISSNTSSSANIMVQPTEYMSAGTYTTTLRFVTGKEDGSQIQYADLPVTYTVSKGAEVTTTGDLIFNALGTAPDAVSPSDGYDITLSGASAQWTINTDADWLNLSTTSAQGDATVAVTATPIGGLNGFVTGTITVRDVVSNAESYLYVTMNGTEVQPVVDTSLPVTSVLPDSPDTSVSLPLQISDSLDGVSTADAFNWQLSSQDDADWLSFSAPSGSTAAGSPSAEVILDKTVLLAKGTGIYQSTIDVTLTNAYGTTVSSEIPVRAFVADPGTEISDSVANQLDFTLTDLVADEQNRKLYVTDKDAKKLYVVDISTGLTERYFEFRRMPERLALSSAHNRLYITLLDREHDHFLTIPESGAIVSLDTTTQTLDQGFAIDLDPYDLVINSDQKLVVSSGSSQFSNINLYHATSGELLGFNHIRHQSRLTLHPNQSWVFAATTDVSPGDITLFPIEGDALNLSGDSPYHGEYSIWGRVWATPNGNHLITAGGDVFLAPSMVYTDTITAEALPLVDVAFDHTNGVAYTVNSSGEVNRYAENSFTEIIPLLQTQNTAVRVFVIDGVPYAVTAADDRYYLEILQ